MKVPLCKVYVDKEIKDTVNQVLDSGQYIRGKEVKNFQNEFASYIGTKHAIATNSGTSALQVAMEVIGLKPGDEVLVPSHTFIASVSPIIHRGAKPILVDIDINTYTMDVEDVKNKITSKTKAIIPVHLYGHPCRMSELVEISKDNNLLMIEDCAQAHGAMYKGKKVGTFGDINCFSFFPSKIMTVAGDGGMIVTNNKELAENASALIDTGRLPGCKYTHAFFGYNYRMSEILASIGRIQLKHLEEWITLRRKVSEWYKEKIRFGPVLIPYENPFVRHAYYVYTIRLNRRDKLKKFLDNKGISTGIYYPIPVHKQPCWGSRHIPNLPVTNTICDEILSLPMHPQLSYEDVDYISKSIAEFFT